MKKMKVVVLAITLVSIFGASNAFASDSAQIDVSATIQEACYFSGSPYQMDFGIIDPVALPATGKTVTTTLNFTCNTNSDYTLGDVAGSHQMSDGTNNLDYTIATYTLSATPTPGSANTLDIVGNVSKTAALNAVASTGYVDTLTITILP